MEYLIFSLVIIILILGFTYHGGALNKMKLLKKIQTKKASKNVPTPLKKVDTIRLLRKERRNLQSKYYHVAGTTQVLPDNRKCACGGQIISHHPIFKCQKCSQKFKYIYETETKSA